MRKLLITAALVTLLPLNLFAWDRSYVGDRYQAVHNRVTSVEVLGWQTNLDGNVNVDDFDVDLDSDANFDDENTLGLRISHVLSQKSLITLSYMKTDFSGTIKTPGIKFNGKIYKVGASADIENSWLDLTYAHNLVQADSEKVNGITKEAFYLDGLLGVKFGSAEISASGRDNITNAYIEDSWSEDFPVPYIGLAAGGQLSKNVWARGHFKYISVNAGGNDALHQDYGINVALRLNPDSPDTEWFVDLGYKGVKYDVDADNDNVDLKYCGPTLGVFARF